MAERDRLKCLIGSKVQILAEVGANCKEKFSNIDRIVLNDIYINNVFFRDHAWIKKTKRFKNIQIGDIIQTQATLVEYKDVSGAIKIGLKSFRNIVIVDSLL